VIHRVPFVDEARGGDELAGDGGKDESAG
jgi:hypothetical protein